MLLGREEKVPQVRLTAVQYTILGIFLVLAFGLWRLQVVGSDYYASLAEQNRVRKVPILAPRGKILDREGRIIVDNYPSFSALLLRDQQRDLYADVPRIAEGLHMPPDEVRERLRRFASMPQYQPIILKDDITPDELAFIEAHRNELPELDTIMSHRRLYPKNGFLAHLIGYVGEVSKDMLDQEQFQFYEQGDIVGMSGVERQYNDLLMGKNGARNVIVNSRGKVIRPLDENPAVPGKPLKLTVDIDLQIAAEEALGDKNGAIVALDPHTGEILAMVSRPAFDPNAFAVRITREEWNQLITDEAHPLLNKAIQAQLAPGSVFKIIMAVAGLQENISQTLHVNCGGGATFYGRRFACWVKTGHGGVEIRRAIYQSCDVYFYTLAERLGIGRIAQYATALGFGQKTHIDLPQEASGVMPSEEWKIKNFKQKWYAGETISVGIGQGAVATTPIQLARALGGIAMDGRLMRPHVAFPDLLPRQYQDQMAAYPAEVTVPIDPENWQTITDAMAEVVNPIGTAPSAHLKDIDLAGKTGSSQTISNAGKARLTGSRQQFRDNGWFVGFTPRRDPDIVVTALIEQGEHGYLAARVVAQVIKAYVDKQRKREATKMAAAGKPGTIRDRYSPPLDEAEKPAPKTAPGTPITRVWPSRPRSGQDAIEISGFAAATLPNGEEKLTGSHFRIQSRPRAAPLAVAAPGIPVGHSP
jgi:penicillin-binding protein 2